MVKYQGLKPVFKRELRVQAEHEMWRLETNMELFGHWTVLSQLGQIMNP